MPVICDKKFLPGDVLDSIFVPSLSKVDVSRLVMITPSSSYSLSCFSSLNETRRSFRLLERESSFSFSILALSEDFDYSDIGGGEDFGFGNVELNSETEMLALRSADFFFFFFFFFFLEEPKEAPR